MAKLIRYQRCGCFHFPIFGCYRMQTLLTRLKSADEVCGFPPFRKKRGRMGHPQPLGD
jgi:hypothetical protein